MEALGAGEIEIGFVDGGHFDNGRKFREDGGDAVAPLGVEIVAAFEKNCVRAEAAGGSERHGGMNAEDAGFVAGGGNYSTAIGLAADYYGLAAEGGTVEEFDGNEESVHVYVEDGRDGAREGRGVLLGAEMG